MKKLFIVTLLFLLSSLSEHPLFARDSLSLPATSSLEEQSGKRENDTLCSFFDLHASKATLTPPLRVVTSSSGQTVPTRNPLRHTQQKMALSQNTSTLLFTQEKQLLRVRTKQHSHALQLHIVCQMRC